MSTVDPNKHYGRCDSLDEKYRPYCREYIDQCVAQRATRDARDSTYELVSASGKKSTGLKFIDCIQLSPIYALHGKPKAAESPAGKIPPAKPDTKPSGQEAEPVEQKPVQKGTKIILHRCNTSHFQPADARPPAWVGANVPEYAFWCYKDPVGVYSDPSLDSIEFMGRTMPQLVGKYCTLTVQTTKTERKDSEETKTTSKGNSHIIGTDPRLYTERRGDMTCIHGFYNWSIMTCPDGTEYVCE